MTSTLASSATTNSISGAPSILTDDEKREFCSIVSFGCDRSTACKYLGLKPAELRRELKRDSDFRSQLLRSEAVPEMAHMQILHKASKDEKNWRISVWWLERQFKVRLAKLRLAKLRQAKTRQAHEKKMAANSPNHIAQKSRNRSPLLGTIAWGQRYLPKHFSRPPSRMHLWLSRKLDAMHLERGEKINLVGPRGSAKSTVGSLCYVLQAIVEGCEPYVWIVSDTKDQAQTHLENIKTELEENELLAVDYPHAASKGTIWRAGTLRLQNGAMIEAFGTGQQLRGRRHREHRPTLIVCDDLENDSHIVSALQRESSRQWFHGTLVKAGDEQTNIVNLATALHRDALAMRLHNTPGWNSALFRSIEQWPTETDLWQQWEEIYCNAEDSQAGDTACQFYEQHRDAMDAGAEVLWPEAEDLYTLMKMRVESGQTAFEREKQSSPIDPERCEWPEEYFADHIWFQQWPENLQIRTVALDPSKGADARLGDYSAFVLLGVDRSGYVYVEADLSRRPTPQMVADGVRLCTRFQPDAFGVESNQYQELLAGELIAEFRRQGVRTIPPCAIHNHVNKQVRIRRLAPYLSQRRLRFLATSPDTRLLVDQLRDFPLGAHDDGPDALEMALRLAEERFRSGASDDGLGNRLPITS